MKANKHVNPSGGTRMTEKGVPAKKGSGRRLEACDDDRRRAAAAGAGVFRDGRSGGPPARAGERDARGSEALSGHAVGTAPREGAGREKSPAGTPTRFF